MLRRNGKCVPAIRGTGAPAPQPDITSSEGRAEWQPPPLSGLDIAACLVAPLVCLALDRGFGSWGPRGSAALFLTPGGLPVGRMWIGQLMLAAGIWIALRPRSPILSGFLAASALWAGAFGLAIVPLSLAALMLAGIGLFGFAPLVAAWRCGLGARRAFAAAVSRCGRTLARRRAILGLVLGLSLPFSVLVLPELIEPALERLVTSPEAGVPMELRLLRPVLVLLGADPAHDLAERWLEGHDGDAQERLARAYHALTGGDVESSLLVQWRRD